MTKPTVSLADVLSFVHKASFADRKAIGEALNAAREDDIYAARAEFKVGDKVMFAVKKRGYPPVIRGVITSKNVKTFHVRPNDGGREWKVTASLVQRDDQ